MTIKDLQRIVLTDSDNQSSEDSPAMKEFLKRVYQKPFWLWNKTGGHEERRKSTNNQCCFNHILPAGPPKKNGVNQPFWDYQYSVFKSLFDPTYLNLRPPTEEEREKYNRLMVEAELMAQSKKGNIKQTHQGVLAQRTKELIYPFKCKPPTGDIGSVALVSSGVGLVPLVPGGIGLIPLTVTLPPSVPLINSGLSSRHPSGGGYI